MNEVTMFGGAGLPSVKSLAAALRSVSGPSNMVIIKCDKTGHWVFGAESLEIEDDSLWAINPFSLVHGYIAWGDGEVLAEKMVSVTEPLPEIGPAPAGAEKGWEVQVGMTLACTNGHDEGVQARYSVTSVGGKRAVNALGMAIAEQVDKDQTKPVPVVSLKSQHYMHKKYGKIYAPIFDIVKWVSMDATSAEEDAEEAEVPAEDAPRRRRRV